MNPNYAGALINSALFLIAVFVAGLMTNNSGAWKFAIVAIGITFLSHVAQVLADAMRQLRGIAITLIALSWVFAIAGAVELIF